MKFAVSIITVVVIAAMLTATGMGQGSHAYSNMTPDAVNPPRCGIKAGTVTQLATKIQTWLQNLCIEPTISMKAHVCLMRKATYTSIPQSFNCMTRWGSGLTVTASTSKACNYTTWPYIWYAQGWGEATFKDGTYRSATVKGPEALIKCN